MAEFKNPNQQGGGGTDTRSLFVMMFVMLAVFFGLSYYRQKKNPKPETHHLATYRNNCSSCNYSSYRPNQLPSQSPRNSAETHSKSADSAAQAEGYRCRRTSHPSHPPHKHPNPEAAQARNKPRPIDS